MTTYKNVTNTDLEFETASTKDLKFTSGNDVLISAASGKKLSISGTTKIVGSLESTAETSLATSSGAVTIGSGGGIVDIGSTGVMTTVKGTLNIDQAVTLDSTLSVEGITRLKSTLNVGGATTLESTLSVGNEINVKTTDNPQVDIKSVGGYGWIGIASAHVLHFGTQNGGDLTIKANGDVNIVNATTLQSSLSVEGTSYLKGDVTLGGSLTVNGTTTTVNTSTVEVEDPILYLANSGAGSTDIGFIGQRSGSSSGLNNIAFIWDESADEFAVVSTDDTTENTNVNILAYADLHTAALTGSSGSFSSTLGVTGATTLSSTLAVSRNAILSSTLSVGNEINVKTALGPQVDIKSVDGYGWIGTPSSATTQKLYLGTRDGADFTIDKEGNIGIGNVTSPTANLDVGGTTQLRGTLSVSGATTLESTLSIGTTSSYENLIFDANGRLNLHVPNSTSVGLFDGLWGTDSSSGRAQFVLSSAYSDMVIASGYASDYYGSTLTFAAFNPSNTSQYSKFVINQGGWGARKDKLNIGYCADQANPHYCADTTNEMLTLDGTNKRVGIKTRDPTTTLDVTGTIKGTQIATNGTYSIQLPTSAPTANKFLKATSVSNDIWSTEWANLTSANWSTSTSTSDFYTQTKVGIGSGDDTPTAQLEVLSNPTASLDDGVSTSYIAHFHAFKNGWSDDTYTGISIGDSVARWVIATEYDGSDWNLTFKDHNEATKLKISGSGGIGDELILQAVTKTPNGDSISPSNGWNAAPLRFRNGGLNGSHPYEWNVTQANTADLYFYYNNGGNSGGNGGYGSARAYLNYTVDVSALDFTGQHRAITNNTKIMDNINNYIGLIVSSTGKITSRILNKDNNNFNMKSNKEAITINESIPEVNLSNKRNDKKCFGIISNSENKNSNDTEYTSGALVTVIQTDNDDTRLYINSVGEGAIWVSNINGNIENGDYITTSDIAGYGMKQDDDLLHNYTVAKATMDCTFDNTQTDKYETKLVKKEDGTEYIAAFIACTYHCG